MPLYGLDVSEHNNGLNLHTAQQEGYDFAIIRICDGTYKDPIFNLRLPSFSGHPICADLVSVGEDVHCESTAQEVHAGVPA